VRTALILLALGWGWNVVSAEQANWSLHVNKLYYELMLGRYNLQDYIIQVAESTVPGNPELAKKIVRSLSNDAPLPEVRETIRNLLLYGRKSPGLTPAEGAAVVLYLTWRPSVFPEQPTKDRKWITSQENSQEIQAIMANLHSPYVREWFTVRTVLDGFRKRASVPDTAVLLKLYEAHDIETDYFRYVVDAEAGLPALKGSDPWLLFFLRVRYLRITRGNIYDDFTQIEEEELISMAERAYLSKIGRAYPSLVHDITTTVSIHPALYNFALVQAATQPSMAALVWKILHTCSPDQLSPDVWDNPGMLKFLHNCAGVALTVNCQSGVDEGRPADVRNALLIQDQMQAGLQITDYFAEEVWKQRKSN